MYHPAAVVRLFFLAVLLACVSACHQRSGAEDTGPAKKYSFYILGKDGRQFIFETNSLKDGVYDPEKLGAELNASEMDRELIVRDGFYYRVRKSIFSKYRMRDRVLERTAKAEIKNFSEENYLWLAKDTLLLIGLDNTKYAQARFAIVQTEEMKVLRSGDLDIPLPPEGFASASIGFVDLKNGRIRIGFTFHPPVRAGNFTTSDTTYVTALTYPEFKPIGTDKDTRSTYPGGMNTVQTFSFTDEKGDFYFVTCPGIALGNRPDRPSGVYRINAGEDFPDKNYFLNISASRIGNHAYGIWYLGNGKAIVRTERRDLFKGLNDHYSAAHFEFYLLDLAEGKVIKKMDLPLDKGTRRECILIEGDIAYIAINSSTEGNFIWLYHIKEDRLEKGAELVGDTDYMMRMDKLSAPENLF